MRGKEQQPRTTSQIDAAIRRSLIERQNAYKVFADTRYGALGKPKRHQSINQGATATTGA